MKRFEALSRRGRRSASTGGSEASVSSNGDVLPPLKGVAIPFPDGVEVLHDCPDAVIDICFVHGLTGNRRTTWTARGHSKPWPETLLPGELDRARILSYGYDAYVVRKSTASLNGLTGHAGNLLNDLANDRASAGATHRPIVFVAHSLGGLVCKEVVLQARDNPDAHLRSLFDCVKGVLFMGTPHKGSWMASWAEIPARAFGIIKSTNTSLLKTLKTDDQHLLSVQDRFCALIRELKDADRTLGVTCAYEELPMVGIGPVVSQDSATMEGCKAISIHANHREMVRFASLGDNGFKRVLGELVRWRAEVLSSVDTSTAPEEEMPPTKDAALDACAKSLAFSEMEDRFHDIVDATDGTCHWLFEHDMFKAWAQSDRDILWIKGKPGSGKSIMMAFALRNTEKIQTMEETAMVISFFFHGQGTESQKSPSGLFRALLYQLLRKAPEALAQSDIVTTFRKRQDESDPPGEAWKWKNVELERFFKSSLVKVLETRPVWLLVDALDECGEVAAVELADAFTSLVRNLPSEGLKRCHLLFSCRHYPILHAETVPTISIEGENRTDLAQYVSTRLPTSLPTMPPTVPAMIIDRADGVFLWARLVVEKMRDYARKGLSGKKMEAEIKALPRELHDLYAGLVEEMVSNESLLLLQWICFSIRPLSSTELRWALTIEHAPAWGSMVACNEESSYPQELTGMERRMQSLSCGLAEVTPGSEIVQFIHQSVRDFFLSRGVVRLAEKLNMPWPSMDMKVIAGLSHRQCAIACLKYLSMREIGSALEKEEEIPLEDELNATWPFLHYAVTSWAKHVGRSDAEGVEHEYINEYFSQDSPLLERWTKAYAHSARYSSERPKDTTTLLHILARYRGTGALQFALDNGHSSSVNTKDAGLQTPLTWAIRAGSQGAVQLLLDHGANVNEPEGVFGKTPLYIALEDGETAIMELLLNGGADIEAKETQDEWTPLFLAIWLGSESAIARLLDLGANLEATDNRGRTPLVMAKTTNKSQMAQYLEKRGARKDAIDAALFFAVQAGQEFRIRQLVDKGANIESRNPQGLTPLFFAVVKKQWHLIPLLVELGATMLTTDKKGRTALAWAADTQNLRAAFFLLRQGAYIRIADDDGFTKLGATFCGHEDSKDLVYFLYAVALIRGRGSTRRGKGMTLTVAVGTGLTDVCKSLLEDGVSVETADEYGLRPLTVAVLRGDIDLCRLLLDWGAEVDRGKGDMNTLAIAIRDGHEAIVSQLISHGADIELVEGDTNARSALGLAVAHGHEGIVQLLLNIGANMVTENEGTTPVKYRLWRTSEEGLVTMEADGVLQRVREIRGGIDAAKRPRRKADH